MKLAKRFLAITLAMLMVCTVLAGCGSTQSSAPAATEAPAQTAEQAPEQAAEEAAPAGDGTIDELRIGFTSTVDSIAPFVSYGDVLTQLRYYMWEYLAVPDADFELKPQVAKSWSTEDGLTYEVEIFDYVTDSQGNAITAEDVAFDYETYKASGRSGDMANLESVTVTGDYTLTFKLTTDSVGIWEKIAYGCPIVSRAAFEASSDEMASKPVGTAVYKVESFEPGASVVLVRRDDYWQQDELRAPLSQSNIGRMTFKFIPDASQCAIALETGDVDISLSLPMTTVTQYADNPDYEIKVTSGASILVLMSGDSHSPLSDNQALRQAVCYAIDNEGMVKAVNGGYGGVLHDLCAAPYAADYNPEWDEQDYYNYSVDQAKAKLEEAGFGANELSLSILVPSVGSYKRYAEVLQGYLMAVGIGAEINAVEPALYSSSLRDPSQYDLVITPGTYTYSSQAWLQRLSQKQNGGRTFNGFVDDELEALLEGCSHLENHTVENLNACHDYVTEQAYGYGLFMIPAGAVMNAKLNITDLVFCPISLQVYLAGTSFNG